MGFSGPAYKPIEEIMETYIGLDFGGTKLLIGEVDCDGHILGQKIYTTGYVNQNSAVGLIKDSLSDYLETVGTAGRRPVAIGIGMIGRVDTDHGQWLQIDTNRSDNISLADEVKAEFGYDCFISNDVKSATIAEQCWGFGRESENFIYINIGTGIAAGCVVGGRLICGSHYNAGEVGHTQVGVHAGVKCCCGRTDCVEAIAAGVGFDSCARLLAAAYPDSPLYIPSDGTRVDVRLVYDLYRQGDGFCKLLVENAATAIANLIMNLVRVTDPDTVVLGGGIVSDPMMYSMILERLHPATMRFVSNGVVMTRLSPSHVGLLGAAAVAMTESNKVLETV